MWKQLTEGKLFKKACSYQFVLKSAVEPKLLKVIQEFDAAN